MLHHTRLNHGTLPLLLPMHSIKPDPEQRRPAPQQTAEIHARRIHRHGRGPKAEEHGDDGPDQGEDVDGHACTTEGPGSEF